jgi:hypothetical protein
VSRRDALSIGGPARPLSCLLRFPASAIASSLRIDCFSRVASVADRSSRRRFLPPTVARSSCVRVIVMIGPIGIDHPALPRLAVADLPVRRSHSEPVTGAKRVWASHRSTWPGPLKLDPTREKSGGTGGLHVELSWAIGVSIPRELCRRVRL